MRNYAGYNNGKNPERGRAKLVIEDNTIYEIDLDCYECRKKEEVRKEKKEQDTAV